MIVKKYEQEIKEGENGWGIFVPGEQVFQFFEEEKKIVEVDGVDTVQTEEIPLDLQSVSKLNDEIASIERDIIFETARYNQMIEDRRVKLEAINNLQE